ncbi:MAG: outer membrane protein assembly factor BamA [bacterium]|nr:outer membrane protein assembly factor BamA [bacterium]
MRLKKGLVFSLLLLTASGFSATIEKIDVRGSERVEKEKILSGAKVKVGDEFLPKKTSDWIKVIYSLGEFSDVACEVTEENGSVTLSFVLQEVPLIGTISFSGQKEKKKEDIERALGLKTKDPLFIPKIEENKASITTFYKNEGFYFAQVSYQIKGEELIFTINEGKSCKIKEVKFLGNKSISSYSLRGRLKTGKKDAYIPETLKADLEALTALYCEKGFAKVAIDQPVVFYDEKKKGLVIEITIHEGSKYNVGKVEIIGNSLFSESEIRKVMTLKEASVFNQRLLERDFRAIGNLYYEKGYISAQVVPIPSYRIKAKIIDYSIQIEEGEISYIEKIELAGNKRTKDKVIKRELLIKEGEILCWDKVSKSRHKLALLGFFDNVDLSILSGSEENKKTVKIEVTEGKRGTGLFGVNYSNQTGLAGSVQLNVVNLFGQGYSANLKSDFGKKILNYEASFTDPWFLDRPISLGLGLWNNELSRDSYKESKRGGYISLGKPIQTFNRIYIKYKLDQSRFTDIKSSAPSNVQDWEKRWKDRYATTSGIETGITRDSRAPNIFEPERGGKLSLSYETAGGILGGDIDFYKPIFEASWYHPSLWKFILCFHTNFGFINSENSDDIPDYEKFYLGGARTVRGYNERSIHPSTGGGDSFFLSNLEYRLPLGKGLTFALFLDAGQVWTKGKEELLDLKSGYGFGIRFNSPVGPLQFDYAWPMEKEEPQFHFSIGPSF